jgi:hypothetical protein
LALCASKNIFSVAAVDRPEFKNFLSQLQPLCKVDLPSRKNQKIKKETYLKIADDLDKFMINSPGRVSLKIDGWTSRNVMGYFAVIVSFVDTTFESPNIVHNY